jgi:hypothetical protein
VVIGATNDIGAFERNPADRFIVLETNAYNRLGCSRRETDINLWFTYGHLYCECNSFDVMSSGECVSCLPPQDRIMAVDVQHGDYLPKLMLVAAAHHLNDLLTRNHRITP